MTTYTLYTADGAVAVDDIEATAEEMLLAIKAANTKQPDSAPHYAVSGDEQLQTDDTLDERIVDSAMDGAREDA